ncbi:MAG: glycosyltransferase family 4 protein [Syntrophobacterales bacterium]|nr:glycosyltransferase family 4 protein [Syntrophobacterales bacterium]
MKILFVSDVSIQEVIGGAERVLFEQTTRLAERGHLVHILTRRLPRHSSDTSVIRGVTEWHYHVSTQNAVSFWISTLKNAGELFERLQMENHYDSINFHQPFSAYAVIRSRLSKEIRKTYTCHSLSFEEYRSRNALPPFGAKRIFFFLQIALRRWIEKRVLSKSARIIVLSSYTAEKLVRNYAAPRKKIAIVPGGIDLVRFAPPRDKNAAQELLGLPPGKFVMLTVRNLVSRMGLENLLLAMVEVLKKCPDSLLVIGGTGPLEERLKTLAQDLKINDHLLFKGFIPEDELPDYYRAADIFVLPTVDLEGFGLVTLEALASGTPVLGTPVGGTNEILKRFDSDFLFKSPVPEDMAELMIKICSLYKKNPEKQNMDSVHCRRFAQEHYSWEANVTATEEILAGSSRSISKTKAFMSGE